MAPIYDRTLLIEAQNQLLNLLVQHDEATKAEEWRRVSALDTQIAAARVYRDKLRTETHAEIGPE